MVSKLKDKHKINNGCASHKINNGYTSTLHKLDKLGRTVSIKILHYALLIYFRCSGLEPSLKGKVPCE
jgi:hypothetical protein